MMVIDLNCDMGEGMPTDASIMPFISSANIACGLHAGDDATMHRTIALALQHNLAIGAHPSFDDRKNFGRSNMQLAATDLYQLVYTQVRKMQTIAANCQAKLHHVKPHGALYNMAAKDAAMSKIIVAAVKDADPHLVFYGLSNSCMITQAKAAGLRTAAEVFADRTYTDSGELTPRSQPNALITNEAAALAQVMQMIRTGTVTTTSGKQLPITAQTICIHGDGDNAVGFAKQIYHALKKQDIDIKAIQ